MQGPLRKVGPLYCQERVHLSDRNVRIASGITVTLEIKYLVSNAQEEISSENPPYSRSLKHILRPVECLLEFVSYLKDQLNGEYSVLKVVILHHCISFVSSRRHTFIPVVLVTLSCTNKRLLKFKQMLIEISCYHVMGLLVIFIKSIQAYIVFMTTKIADILCWHRLSLANY